MQTLAVQIDDSYMEQFMHFVKESRDKVSIHRDKNLEQDPYFYERRKQLHQLRADVKSGKMPMLNMEEYEAEMKEFMLELEETYGG